MVTRENVLDLAIVGGGLAGLIHLHYARRAGLDAVVLERRERVGGLWRDLPSWQDIQICPVDWTIGDLPLAGPYQPQILANIEAWVERFSLSGGIRLNCPVGRARHGGDVWELETAGGRVLARHLVAASGVHNRPVVPEVRRNGSAVRELHSSELMEPKSLSGKSVVVVGGGASAFDLLDQCLEHDARSIHWAYRNVRWFTPTGKPKAVAGSFRPYARMQASGLPVEQQNALIGSDLRARYEKWGIRTIEPERPIDMQADQLIPGRARMLANFARIERHAATVDAIDGSSVILSNGAKLNADVLLWGTGYATDLTYFEDPAIASIRNVPQMAARCGCVFRSLDAPNLYFPGVGLEGVGATSWMYAIIARTIMSHIRGEAKLDLVPVPKKLNHLDLIRHLAPRDPGSFGPGRDFEYFRNVTATIPDDEAFPLP